MDPQINPTRLIHLIQENKFEELDMLLGQMPQNIKSSTINDNDLLSTAVSSFSGGSVECLRVLIAHGADVDYCFEDDDPQLCIACNIYSTSEVPENKTKYMQIIRMLIMAGANCNMRQVTRYTPLMNICSHQSIKTDNDIQERKDIIELLISHGADRDMVTRAGHTAENLAILNNYMEIAEFVRDYQEMPETKGVHCD